MTLSTRTLRGSVKVAAVDIGTNSTRMLIAEVTSGVVIPLATRMTITRLGEGMSGGVLRDTAIVRTLEVLQRYAEEARREHVARVRAVATSAVRDASNAEDLLTRITRVGFPVDVLDGQGEAALTHLGASAELGPSARCLVIDIGGGSTELVLGVHGNVEAHVSLDVGCVRMSERYPFSDPPTREQTDALQRIIMDGCREATGRFAGAGDVPAIAVAGTATSLAAVKQRLSVYDSERVHGFRMTKADVSGLLDELAAMALDERRRIPSLEAGRADVIVAGTVILLAMMKLLELESVGVSEHGILYGLVLEQAAQAQ